MLELSRAMVEAAETEYRRTYLPPPSRAKPLPDPDAVAGARSLGALSAAIGDLAGIIRSFPAPETDRMTQRYRQEADTLMALGACDQRLVGLAEMLRQMLEGQDHDWILTHQADIREGITLMTVQVRERQSLLK
jgi:hypothetical protein